VRIFPLPLLVLAACTSTSGTPAEDAPQPNEQVPALRTINGNYTVTNSADIDMLANYAEVAGTLVVEAPGMTSLAGLEHLERVRHLVIENCDSLVDLEGLSGLQHVQSVRIANNALLGSLWGLHNVEGRVDAVDVESNPQLSQLAAFGRVDEVAGYISIYGNRNLHSVDGFAQLKEAGGFLIIQENPILNDISSFHSLERVGNGVIIRSNATLNTLRGLEQLTTVQALEIEDNQKLMRLIDLMRLAGIAQDLRIRANPALPMCEAYALRDRVAAVGAIGGDVVVEANGSGSCN